MASISYYFLILGVVVAFVTAQETSTNEALMPSQGGNMSTAGYNSSSATTVAVTSNMSSTMNMTTNNATMTPMATTTKDSITPTAKPMPVPSSSDKPKPAVTTAKKITKGKGTSPPQTAAAPTNNTGIIIIIVIIIVALICGVTCFLMRNKNRRYSVDLTSRPDDANIPLSTVEPELPIDAVPQNGLQTFESEVPATQEPEAKPEEQPEQKAEADKPAAESAAPAPPPDSSEDKPKEDVVEPSPPPPVEQSAEEKTDDEGVDSNKTSVESLKESNENNSNNADLSHKTDLMPSNNFWDVPLNCPV